MKNKHGVEVDDIQVDDTVFSEWHEDGAIVDQIDTLAFSGECVFKAKNQWFYCSDITAHYPKKPKLEVVSDDRGNVYRGPAGTDYAREKTLEYFVCNLSEFLPGGRLDPERIRKLEEVAKTVARGTHIEIVNCNMGNVTSEICDLAREALGDS
jgi:hypothetical protein